MRSLDRIEAGLAGSQQDAITPLRITVRDLKTSFGILVNEQRALGFNETEGTTADLIAAGNAVETIIDGGLTWVADTEAAMHLMSRGMMMRRYETEYRLTRADDAEQHFRDEVKRFNNLLDLVDGAPVTKQELKQDVQRYSYTFTQWVTSRTTSRRCFPSLITTPRACCPRPTRSSPPRRTMRAPP